MSVRLSGAVLSGGRLLPIGFLQHCRLALEAALEGMVRRIDRYPPGKIAVEVQAEECLVLRRVGDHAVRDAARDDRDLARLLVEGAELTHVDGVATELHVQLLAAQAAV